MIPNTQVPNTQKANGFLGLVGKYILLRANVTTLSAFNFRKKSSPLNSA
jgi:hypothetical protein